MSSLIIMKSGGIIMSVNIGNNNKIKNTNIAEKLEINENIIHK